MTRRWWSRNALALTAVAVLAPVTGLMIIGNEWWGTYQAAPVFPTTVAPGDEISYAGATWGPATIHVRPDDPDSDLPEGTTVYVVEVPLDPDSGPVRCSPPTLRELEGGQRQWDDAVSFVDWDYERPTLCDSEAVGPFTIAVPFLVPDDAVGPFGVDFLLTDELPGFLRLVVSP